MIAARALAAILVLASSACLHRDARRLRDASRDLAADIKDGDAAAAGDHVLPGARSAVDLDALVRGTARKGWSRALAKPVEIHPRAELLLAPDHPVGAAWTAAGWRFAEDPLDVYAQDTPRHALRALVQASRHARWDVMIQLAPQRYRVGLSVEDLERAWTEGESARQLQEARDLLAEHLWDPIVADAHEASLDLGGGDFARLEREGPRWVVADF